MKKLTWFLAFALVVTIMAPAFAAPLFPDVPEQHWARDAVADLAAKGILEGYPDGTFKGDRAATRWEMAMALQRFLAKMEAEHATFATKADLEALRALVNNLKDELDALGVRVKNLEENVVCLDKRVTELERITFEGDFGVRFVTIGLKNKGRTVGVFPPTFSNWPNDVGGIFGVTDYPIGTSNMINWRPLVNGSGLTALARLGVKVHVNKDMDAGIRFAAYTALGDETINAYWGLSAPYLSNPFTGNSGLNAGSQNMVNTPWTRMTFDRFWLEHKPTCTKIVAGAIEKTNFDDFILINVPNPNIAGRDRTWFEEMKREPKNRVYAYKYNESACEDAYLPFYGLQVKGKTNFISEMAWEAIYTKLPDVNGDNVLGIADITPSLFGANLHWKIRDQYAIKLNFARVAESSTAPLGADWLRFPVLGGMSYDVTGADIANPGALPKASNLSNGTWINPAGQAGTLPVVYPNHIVNPAGRLFNPSIGTQNQTMYGLSFNYRFEPSCIRIVLEGAGTRYKPTVASSYNVNGAHGRAGIGWTSKNNTFDVDLEYVYTDPYYDAYQLQYPQFGAFGVGGLFGGAGWPMSAAFGGIGLTGFGFPAAMVPPTMAYPGVAYQLHDSDLYPNNRSGVRLGAEGRWSDGNGRANLRFAYLQQAKASSPVLDINGQLSGYKPGFIEPVFNMLHTTGNVIDESVKGKVLHVGGGIEHRFCPSPFKASIQYDYYNFKRTSAFGNATAVAQQNAVNLKNDVLKFGLAYAFNDRFTLRGGVDWTRLKGYHMYYNPYNTVTNTFMYAANTDVVDSSQTTPWIGFDYEVGKNAQWCFDIRYYNQKDNLPTDFYTGCGNAIFPSNPYSYNGIQMMTQFKVKF